jgi:hypothetical protein
MRRAFLNRSGSDVQVVKSFDGGGDKHGVNQAENLLAWKEKAHPSRRVAYVP